MNSTTPQVDLQASERAELLEGPRLYPPDLVMLEPSVGEKYKSKAL